MFLGGGGKDGGRDPKSVSYYVPGIRPVFLFFLLFMFFCFFSCVFLFLHGFLFSFFFAVISLFSFVFPHLFSTPPPARCFFSSFFTIPVFCRQFFVPCIIIKASVFLICCPFDTCFVVSLYSRFVADYFAFAPVMVVTVMVMVMLVVLVMMVGGDGWWWW